LSRIVDAYLVELDKMETLDLDLATEFLLIAATLVELKARRLLPGREDIGLDEEFALWEERDLLLARLLECKTFKDVSQVFGRLATDADLSFPRQVGPEEPFASMVPDMLEGMTGERLRAAFLRSVTPRMVPTIDLFHVAPVRVSVADAVAELVDELPRVGRIEFRRLTSGLIERLEVIVRFLALLEMYKQGWVELEQLDRMGDLEVIWIGEEEREANSRAMAAMTIDDYEG
jgi:segregation and condensation protein A